MTGADRVEAALATFVDDVRSLAVAASSYGEERLTAPCRTLLDTLMAEFNKKFTVVDKAALVEAPEVGVPDFSLRDSAGLLVLCIELKAPSKGADPRKFKTAHDRKQWQRYRHLGNLIYTDGAEWALYHNGIRAGAPLSICDDITNPKAPINVDTARAIKLFRQAFNWAPIPITSAATLAQRTAEMCRALREQAADLPGDLLGQMTRDWREMLFPDMDDSEFLDAYAQTVTFAILAAASSGIEMTLPLPPDRYDTLNLQLHHVASELERRRALLGKALNLLTSSPEIRHCLSTHLEMLLTTVSAVKWDDITSGGGSAWLHFYEDFLAHYDPALRKRSGSYYTPAGIVEWMTRFTDQLLEHSLGVEGFADDAVLVVDPSVGTGTFLLGILDRIEDRVTTKTGPGAVPRSLQDAATKRLAGFEIQSCPYAVAQLRITERLRSARVNTAHELRLYLTDTLTDPTSEQEAGMFAFAPITASRDAANRVKREEPVVVVIGNPPYLDRAGGKGGWVEKELMSDWKPPTEWEVGPHVKNLSNLYVYFWRWSAWKVFEPARSGGAGDGIVSLITTTGFLTGAGFARMRQWLREACSNIWILHLSPEGHHAPPTSQIFEAMRQPVAIVTAVRRSADECSLPAEVRYHMVPSGTRDDKLAHIETLLDLSSPLWEKLPETTSQQDSTAPFLPPPSVAYDKAPAVSEMFPWSGSGVMAGRTWPMHPDDDTLRNRWDKLVSLAGDEQRRAFVEHERDRRIDQGIRDNLLPAVPQRKPIKFETSTRTLFGLRPYAHRSFDRKSIIADKRLINQPNPSLWAAHSNDRQMYLSVPALNTDSTRPLIAASAGAVVSFTDLIPDMHHLAGSRAGRQHPLWRDPGAKTPNITPGLVDCVSSTLGLTVTAEDLFAYVAAIVAHPGYTAMFRSDLARATQLRVPLTADAGLFAKAVRTGRRVLWLHTFGQRCRQPSAPPGPPRIDDPKRSPKVITPIPDRPERLSHDAATSTLAIHSSGGEELKGEIRPVEADVFGYTVAHMKVLDSWFGHRRHTPRGKQSSVLDKINPPSWTASYTRGLLELLNILTMLVDLRSEQQQALDSVTDSKQITLDDLKKAGILPAPDSARQSPPAFGPEQQSTLPV